MPFIQWVVEPKFLSKKELDKSVDNEFDAVAHNSLVSILQQLACVVKYANRIFDDVGTDLKNIHNRSKTLSDRIHKLTDVVSSLDAKSVHIPVGDLTKFSVLKEHFHASQTLETQVFSNETRPLCVQMWYNAAALSPVHIMREIDKYRQDGCRSSKYFVCVPVFRDNQVGLEIETRRPASMCGVRGWQSEDELGSGEVSSNEIRSPDDVNGTCHKEIFRLPLPEEKTHAISLKFSYSDVPIDVTGSSFRRMASFRRSLMQQVEFFTRKKKKKKSKSDRRNTISGGPEIEAALNEFEQKKDSMTKSRKRFSIAEGARFFKEFNGVEHFYSSLRRPAENKSVQTGEDDTKQGSLLTVKNRLYETLNSKDKNTNKGSSKEEHKKTKSKSNIPISTYSQAMSLAVKLRGNASRSTGKGEDSGQSSSGNWSASSSTRTSVESENLRLIAGELARSSSQASLSKDSALSEGTLHNDDNSDTRVGYQSDNSVSTNASLKTPTHTGGKKFSSKDTEQWLRGLRKESVNGEDTTDGTSTTGTLTPLLGKRTLSPLPFIDDEDSSVYSVDTDGYYTSMHTDSGLRSLSSSSKPLDTMDKDTSDDAENTSTLSSVSTIDQTDSSETKTTNEEEKVKKTPPAPPKRMSSLSTKNSGEQKSPKGTQMSISPAPSSSSSPSPESEVEARDALKRKTIIDASRIPSMCIVTPNPSDDEVSTDNSGGSVERKSIKAHRRSFERELHEMKKMNSWTNGSNTLPRSFGRSVSLDQFSTHSWPRTPLNQGKINSMESSSSELGSNSEEKSPRLPLKYVQHIIVTPGGRHQQQQIQQQKNETKTNKSQTKANVTPLVSPTDSNADTPKIIYATSSLDRKKIPQANRQGAYVALDSQGRVVPNTHSLPRCEKKTSEVSGYSRINSNEHLAQPTTAQSFYDERYAVPKNNVSTSIYSEPNTRVSSSSSKARSMIITGERPTSFQYNSNTLPRARLTANGPPVPLFPSNRHHVSFRPDTHHYAETLPSKFSANTAYNVPQRQASPPSPDDESSPRGSIADLPPPMMLISPSTSQNSRRWSYAASPANVMGNSKVNPQTNHVATSCASIEPRGGQPLCRPSYLPVAKTSQNGRQITACTRPPTPLYRPPPNPVVRNQCNARPQTPTTPTQKMYQIVPRYQAPASPQNNQTPSINYRTSTPVPTQTSSAPVPPQRHYILNISPGVQLRGSPSPTKSPNKTISGQQQQQLPYGVSSVRNGYHAPNQVGLNYNRSTMNRELNSPSSPRNQMEAPRFFSSGQKSCMSSDDLFAVIHQSKKRLNVRGDTERSASPLSYRSESPSPFASKGSNMRSNNPETGTLSPRCMSPGDRKSWAGDASPSGKNGYSSPGDRRSWALDRLGPNKPTTMHDFKMLLLQAGRNNAPNTERTRKSASEMLKVSPAKNLQATPIVQAKTPPQTSYNGEQPSWDTPPSQQRSSPRTINHNLYGRNRARYAFHPHTDILSSPIWEDKMEDDAESPVSEERSHRSQTSPPISSQYNLLGMNPRNTVSINGPRKHISYFLSALRVSCRYVCRVFGLIKIYFVILHWNFVNCIFFFFFSPPKHLPILKNLFYLRIKCSAHKLVTFQLHF